MNPNTLLNAITIGAVAFIIIYMVISLMDLNIYLKHNYPSNTGPSELHARDRYPIADQISKDIEMRKLNRKEAIMK